MINAIGTYIGNFKRTFDADSIAELSNTVQLLSTSPTDTSWQDSTSSNTRTIRQGRCYAFDGVDDYVSVPTTTFRTSGSFSVWAFIPTGVLGGCRIFGTNHTSGGDYRFRTFLSGTSLSYIFPVGTGVLSTYAYGITLDAWQHLSVTWVYDGANTTFNSYINGTLSHNLVAAGSVIEPDTSVTIGKWVTNESNVSLFDLRFFDRAITSSEVLSLYNNSGTLISGVLAHYKMDETDGTISYDSSGNGNDGTITNATLSTFHTTQNLYSFQNEVGYSDGSGDVRVPRDESDTPNDVLGNALDYTGRVSYDVNLVESNCGTFDGVNDYVSIDNLSANVAEITIYVKPNITLDSTTNRVELLSANNENFGIWLGTNVTGTFDDEVITYGTISPFRLFAVENVSILNTKTTKLSFKYNAVESYYDVYIDDVLQIITDPGWELDILSLSDMVVGKRTSLHYGGLIYNLLLKDDSDNEITDLPFSEGAGTIIYDVSGNGNHGTATNITESSFWANTQDKFHWNLTHGFSYSVYQTGLTTNRVNFPVAPYLDNSTVQFDMYRIGSAFTLLNSVNTFGYAFGGKSGDAGALHANAGTPKLYVDNVLISATTRTDVLNAIPLQSWVTIKITELDISGWGALTNTYAPNATYGNKGLFKNFKIDQGGTGDWDNESALGDTDGFTNGANLIRVPAYTDGTADVHGNTITNPAGAWHNNAETKLSQSQAPALIQADSTDNFWFNSSGVSQAKVYSDIVDDVGDNHYSMADVSTSNQKTNLSLFDPALTDPDLADVQEFLNH